MVSKVDPELRNVLQVLGFFDLTSVPKMKDVVKMFRKMALKKHPDKPGGSTEEFQILQEAFLKVGSHIESQQNENVNDSSKDSNSEDFEESVVELYKPATKINLEGREEGLGGGQDGLLARRE